MTKTENTKTYDLEERTFEFAKRCRDFIKKPYKTIANIEDGGQLIKASGSVGANYIEANESLSKKHFVLCVKISRKEAKESRYRPSLLETGNSEDLIREQGELEVCVLAQSGGSSLLIIWIFVLWICFGFRYSNFGFSCLR
ncbi:MAG: four helix bundle protein [Deltaproteobacteria bacterium]|nr:four helix bundle protein [Deltaproteobacteria bacterium]